MTQNRFPNFLMAHSNLNPHSNEDEFGNTFQNHDKNSNLNKFPHQQSFYKNENYDHIKFSNSEDNLSNSFVNKSRFLNNLNSNDQNSEESEESEEKFDWSKIKNSTISLDEDSPFRSRNESKHSLIGMMNPNQYQSQIKFQNQFQNKNKSLHNLQEIQSNQNKYNYINNLHDIQNLDSSSESSIHSINDLDGRDLFIRDRSIIHLKQNQNDDLNLYNNRENFEFIKSPTHPSFAPLKLNNEDKEEYRMNLEILRLSASIHELKIAPSEKLLQEIITEVFDEFVTDHVKNLIPNQIRRKQTDSILEGLLEEIIKEIIIEEKEFVVLSNEDINLYDKIFCGYKRNEVLVTGYAVEMTRDKLRCLDRTSWLNDEVINFYFNLMDDRNKKQQKKYPQLFPKVHFCNTFFYEKLTQKGYNYDGVRRWTKNVDVFNVDKVIFPIHLSVHWTLAVYDRRKNQLEYYDSMNSSRYGMSILSNLEKYLLDEYLDKKGTPFEEKIKKIVADYIPQQQNGYDCGVFACKFANFISQDLDFTFDQRHMSYFRKRMSIEILRKMIL